MLGEWRRRRFPEVVGVSVVVREGGRGGDPAVNEWLGIRTKERAGVQSM